MRFTTSWSRSCETQLITVLDDISKWRDDVRNVDDVLIMDRSKYTTSSRKTEGAQWELKVGDMRVAHWTVSVASALAKVRSGVPLGTDLGALISLKMCSLRSDSPLTIVCYTKLWIVRKLQGDLRELDLWADKWQMAFNMKCHRCDGPSVKTLMT